MNKIIISGLVALFMLCFHWQLSAQAISLPGKVSSSATGIKSAPLTELAGRNFEAMGPFRTDKTGYHPKDDWILNTFTNPNALPQGDDPVWQKEHSTDRSNRTHGNLLGGWTGLGPDGQFDPGDPSLDVGPNHVVQMTNAGGGSLISIWDKSGNALITELLMESVSGINGRGDPIVLYDQLADRWVLTEFKPETGPNLGWVMGISDTPDATGTYTWWEFNTNAFPDYLKFGIWNEAYIMTTNEGPGNGAFAIDRQAMLIGDANINHTKWNLTLFPTIAFQAPTPVDGQGPNIPANQKPTLMRIADDAWDVAITADRLEYFEMDLDWANPANNMLTGPTFINTDPFDTELCGYLAFSCVPQPNNGIGLDPLREVLMNKVVYRDFGSYASIVATHVTDVNNTDRHGVRWYELRKPTGGTWAIHQQGTYSPDAVNRWMASITINAYGEMILAYNVSDGISVFPGLRFTGREASDPLGMMTIPETTIIDGTAVNTSMRYGDYNTACTDPADESFWFTGQYNVTSDWSTYISHISGTACPGSLVLNGALDGDYVSSGTILSDGTVPNGNNVGLYAPMITTLDKGFTVGPGGGLIAAFGDCSN